MSKSKTRMSGSDVDLFERLKRENRELKREVVSLRKIIDRLDNDYIAATLKQYEKSGAKIDESGTIEYKSKTSRREEEWVCWDCNKGHLRIKVFNKPDGSRIYFRQCSHCDKRTKTQPYNDNIKGLK